MTKEGGAILRQYSSQVPKGLAVVEIGVFLGDSLSYLASGTSNPVYGVDPWDLPGGAPRAEHVRNPLNYLVAQEKTEQYSNVSLIRGFSRDVAKTWNKEKVGLLYIDGKHTYSAVKEDFLSWKRHLAKGAVVIFDDYDHPKYPGVRMAVDHIGKAKILQRFAILEL